MEGVNYVVVGLFVAALLAGGLIVLLLARQPEDKRFLVGAGYAFMGHFLIIAGPFPVLTTQVIGVFMAARAPQNENARCAALVTGVVLRLSYWMWTGE